MPPPTTYVSVVEFAVELEQLRRALLTPERWAGSWGHVRSLERLDPGVGDGTGRRYRTTVRAVLPYTLTWEMRLVEAASHRLRWEADGDLDGVATLELATTPGRTAVHASWSVRPTPRWMRLLWPVARPLFVRNHDEVMRRGAAHLADHLGVALLRCEVGVSERRGDGAPGPP